MYLVVLFTVLVKSLNAVSYEICYLVYLFGDLGYVI
jgi:hypothetical protein